MGKTKRRGRSQRKKQKPKNAKTTNHSLTSADLRQAISLHQAGELDQASQIYHAIIAADPRNADAHHLLGVIADHRGENETAIDLINQAISLNPDNAKAYYHLGNVLRKQGRLGEVVQSYRKALEINPQDETVYNNLGNAFKEQGKFKEAIKAYHQAIAIQPNYANAYNNLGVTLKEQGRSEEAISAYRQALSLNPDYVDAHNNLGIVLERQGKLEEAISAYRQALSLNPDYAKAYNNLGNVFQAQGKIIEAIDSYRQALTIDPNRASYHSNLIFSQDFHPDISLQEQQAERQKWNQRFILPLANSIQSHPNDRNPDRLLRIGYVSADFKRHSAAHGFGQLILSYNQTQFAVFCYSGVVKEDEITKQFKDAVSGWHSTLGKSDKELVEQIRKDEIDILVDLSGHTSGNRLLAFGYKPAPIQVTGIGHDAPGVTTIDYRLTTPIRTRPEEEKHFVENPVYLYFSIGFMNPLETPPVGYLPAYEKGHVTFGCLNRFSKVSDESLELWVSLLKRIPSSKLLLKSGELDDIELRGHTIERLSDLGVSSNRVMLLGGTSRYEHLNTYNQVDISLDPFPYGGGATTLESLFMGSPVVSLTDDSKLSKLAHRNSSTILSPLGLDEWVAKTKDEYVEIACYWANNLENLAQLREQLRGQLEERIARFVPQVEIAYREMWRRWCRNEKPLSIYIE